MKNYIWKLYLQGPMDHTIYNLLANLKTYMLSRRESEVVDSNANRRFKVAHRGKTVSILEVPFARDSSATN